MSRYILPIVALFVAVTMAGCSYDTTIFVAPEIDNVEAVSNGGHELKVKINPDLENVDATISDVRVNGYSLHGDQVCSIDFGDLTGPETGTMECESFPSLLIAQTPDKGEQVEVDGGWFSNPPNLTIRTGSLLYRGHNKSHEFRWIELSGRNRGTSTSDERMMPTNEMYQTMKCYQWKDRQRGADFTVLNNATWLEWEQRSPEKSRQYTLAITNYTWLNTLNQTERFDIEPEGNTYPESDIPPILRSELQDLDDIRGDSANLNRSEFYGLIRSLSDTDVNSTESLESAMRVMPGQYGSWNNTGINCRANPPQYRQNRGGINNDHGQYIHTYVSFNSYTYHVRLATRESFSGKAFENVTSR